MLDGELFVFVPCLIFMDYSSDNNHFHGFYANKAVLLKQFVENIINQHKVLQEI